MNWKKFREAFKETGADEAHFILGIDLGNVTSTIAYFDKISQSAEVIDISGGYGKANVPSALQYAADSKEWIFGEYAILNANGADALLRRFVEKLGGRGYLDIGANPMAVVDVAAVFLKELVGSCRSINPKAQIAGIIAVVPSYYPAEARDEIERVFRICGLERVLIEIYSDRECVLHHYFGEVGEISDERVMVLDYGAREFRAHVFDISKNSGNVKALCQASLFDSDLGCDKIDGDVYEFFAEHYCKASNTERDRLQNTAKEQLFTFTHQHKDMLFAKGAGLVRLYYNFIYPPFSANVNEQQIDDLVTPHSRGIEKFLSDVMEKAGSSSPAHMPDTVILSGGGFEMLWARRLIARLYPQANILSPKNPKGIMAQGAARIAAGHLELVPLIEIDMIDYHKIPWDIGVMIQKDGQSRFYPIIEGGSFWWQRHAPVSFILKDEVRGANPVEIDFYMRDNGGNMASISRVTLADLPTRPPGTTKLAIDLVSTSQEDFVVNITDVGFGEMFPSSGLRKEFAINISTQV